MGEALTCTRCTHKWIQRGRNLPDRCAGCNSPLWNKPRVRKQSRSKRRQRPFTVAPESY